MKTPIAENYVRKAEVLKITDGDTIVCRIDMGFNLFTIQPLRFNRIDAPEMRTDEGKEAKKYLKKHLKVGDKVLVQTFKNPRDKYARWIADIYHDGICLNDLMVENGHAIYREY